ncbi:PEP-CTERM sorting domain-containing protein [Luteolibacter algae]|uniref:PEP-CTERM sorting domain-containing protein n=1 Tax=Luteolibacter algae TaxID=454151 RepID=A0ABW5D9N6_9BACT
MKINTLAVMAGSVIFASSAMATVTLQFIQPFSTTGGVTSNFADASGVAMNGLYWGVIVDTNNTGFGTTYDKLTLSPSLVSTLSTGGTTGSNVLILSNTLTSNTSAFTEFSAQSVPQNPGGVGGIGSITTIELNGSNGVSTGDAFRIVWFDTSGNSAGFLDDSSFKIPTDSATFDYSAVFRGPDPVRAATGITMVPEPSALLLSALGVLGLLRRRR